MTRSAAVLLLAAGVLTPVWASPASASASMYPVVAISAGADVVEGSAASFTLTASPAPDAALSVGVYVTALGDLGAATGVRYVVVPTSGTVSFTVPTTGDNVDEPGGSVTAGVLLGSGYAVGPNSLAAVRVADDVPEVTISAGAGVVEGSAAGFTLSASPAPDAALSVRVSVTAEGDFGAATGVRYVVVPTTGTVSFTVPTTGDRIDEADGSVTATVQSGSGYSVGANGSAAVRVADDDPEVAISAGAGVVEGSAASFTLTASPVPRAALSVSVHVAAVGDFGAATGVRYVVVPASGSVSFTVPTTGDEVDEPDGSVTATVLSGFGYGVGASGSGTVSVAGESVRFSV